MDIAKQTNDSIDFQVFRFINEEVLPHCQIPQRTFWLGVQEIVEDLSPENDRLLQVRATLQQQINQWHQDHQNNEIDQSRYENFLKKIGYLLPEGRDFEITTENVDEEISSLAAPQLVVPLKNARFAINAANARWGSLYDALYGTDAISQEGSLAHTQGYNSERGQKVIEFGRDFLDKHFPLKDASHHHVTNYMVYYSHLIVMFEDGSSSWLDTPSQFVAFSGQKSKPDSILLKNNGLHVELQFNRASDIGLQDKAGIQNLMVEAALTTIMDCEDSVAAVTPEEKVEVYRNWLGLILGNLSTSFEKDGHHVIRQLNRTKEFTRGDGTIYHVSGRSLMLIRNVGLLMDSQMMRQDNGAWVYEGILDAIFTALIASIDLTLPEKQRNSQNGSIYIVKPKLHGPEEVEFTCRLFSRIETLLHLPPCTLKLGIMDEERRTSLNLKECIRVAKDRVFFINTGFLDRTGDEIHTSMEAGPFYPKDIIKQQPWFEAYEKNNVDIGLRCGFSGRAQIGKGMWAMPDQMKKMLETKVEHPLQGASTSWVPSPTAAVLHALHYHDVNVLDLQKYLPVNQTRNLKKLLNIPVIPSYITLKQTVIESEIDNNLQSLLGYVVRWIDLGIGCSKVPNLQQVALMEDRATLRISSQHLSNWLYHRICSKEQILQRLEKIAHVVDGQNKYTPGYRSLLRKDKYGYDNPAMSVCKALIFEARHQANGYTEPLLHEFRLKALGH